MTWLGDHGNWPYRTEAWWECVCSNHNSDCNMYWGPVSAWKAKKPIVILGWNKNKVPRLGAQKLKMAISWWPLPNPLSLPLAKSSSQGHHCPRWEQRKPLSVSLEHLFKVLAQENKLELLPFYSQATSSCLSKAHTAFLWLLHSVLHEYRYPQKALCGQITTAAMFTNRSM